MKLLATIIFFFFIYQVTAQVCEQEILYPDKGALITQIVDNNQLLADWKQKNGGTLHQKNKYTLPVVFHVVWYDATQRVSRAQIGSQIQVLNTDFNRRSKELEGLSTDELARVGNAAITFSLAAIDPFGNPTAGITYTHTDKKRIGASQDIYYSDKGGADAWDTKRYINIWICDIAPAILGYASLPHTTDSEVDGLVINYRFLGFMGTAFYSYPYNMGRTLTHEMGHFLNLQHPWGTYQGDCDEFDFVDDTDPQEYPFYDCGSDKNISCQSPDNVHNFMGFEDDECLWYFTKGQVERMESSLLAFRGDLINDIEVYRSKTGIDESLITVFPNPVKGNVLNIHFSEEIKTDLNEPVTLSIFNLLGQKRRSDVIYPIDGILRYELDGEISNGLFIFQFSKTSQGVIATKKVIVD